MQACKSDCTTFRVKGNCMFEHNLLYSYSKGFFIFSHKVTWSFLLSLQSYDLTSSVYIKNILHRFTINHTIFLHIISICRLRPRTWVWNIDVFADTFYYTSGKSRQASCLWVISVKHVRVCIFKTYFCTIYQIYCIIVDMLYTIWSCAGVS